MIKLIFNSINQTGAVSKRFVTKLLFLALLVALNLVGSGPAAAQEPGNTVYLPLIVKSGTNTSTGPFAQMLQKVQQRCAATGLNQVCYVNGQVTLQAKTGTIPFSQPGALADLANVQSLNLTSTGSDIHKWGMAWLRLQADSSTPDQELTILAFGNVQMSNIIPFESQASLTDTVTLPSLQFTSGPVAGVTKWGSSGLIVTNPTDEEILSLTLNGAGIALGSTAFVEAQPGAKMIVTMMTGTSLTEAKDQSSTAVQGEQVSVPLDQNGQASGPPTAPTVTTPVPEPIDELLIPPAPPVGESLTNLNQAIDRCLAGRAASVYNVLYRVHIIETKPVLKSLIDPVKLAQAYSRASNCLSFELEFDSNVNSFTGPLFRSSHVRTEGLPVQFLVNGQFIALNKSLDYLSFVFTPPASPCTPSQSSTPGELEMAAGSLKIAVNKVKISMSLRVVKEAKDLGILTCPFVPPITWLDNWWIFFFDTHKGLLEGQDFRTFGFKDWKYTAPSSQCGGPSSPQLCDHFGEATYEFTGEAESTTYNATTHLILVHTPER